MLLGDLRSRQREDSWVLDEIARRAQYVDKL